MTSKRRAIQKTTHEELRHILHLTCTEHKLLAFLSKKDELMLHESSAQMVYIVYKYQKKIKTKKGSQNKN